MNKHILNTIITGSLVLSLCSCGNKSKDTETLSVKNGYPIHIPFEETINSGRERDLKLSEIADSVKYIPLETTDSSLIHRVITGKITGSSKYWFIPLNKTIYQFTSDGKFVRQIGRRGSGPGDYVYPLSIDIDETPGHIYVLSSDKKINVYDMDTGKFLYRRKTFSEMSWDFAMLNDSVSACYTYNASGQLKDRISISDAEGDTIKNFQRTDLFTIRSNAFYIYHYEGDRYMFKYRDMVCHKEYYNDTLFVVTPDSLKPRYVFDLGKHSMPIEHRPEALENNKLFKELSSSYIRTQAIETDPFLFMPYSYWQVKSRTIINPLMLVYDKNKKECFAVKNSSITNDLGGTADIPFYPLNAVSPKVVISLLPVDDIFEKAEENPSILDHPQLKGLTEDSNPVLMVVYLK